MRFFYVKKEKICHHCGGTILFGEIAVVLRIKWTNGWIIPHFFHAEGCYRNWNEEVFMKRLEDFHLSNSPRPQRKRKPKKIGRPRKYSHNKLAHRLQALICYHRKAGHQDRVEELTNKLQGYLLDKQDSSNTPDKSPVTVLHA